MLSDKGLQGDHQDRLLKSLQRKVSLANMPQPTLKKDIIPKNMYRSGRGSLEDHMKIMKYYICQCGSKFSDIDHSTRSKTNGTALDTYNMNCENCGDTEEVSFMSMKKTLQAANSTSSIDRSDKQSFPYL